MGKSHIDRRVSVATTYPAMPHSCRSGSLARSHRHVARGILPNRANRVHTSTGTSCLSSQSMSINVRMQQKTRRMWRHPQLFSYSYGLCTEEREDQREAKKKDSVNTSQRAALIASGAWDEKERDNVCPRCNRALYAFRSAAGPIMRCRGWDLTGTPCTMIKACQDEAVNFIDRNTNRREDGDLATGSGGPHAGPHAGLGTNILPGQHSGA